MSQVPMKGSGVGCSKPGSCSVKEDAFYPVVRITAAAATRSARTAATAARSARRTAMKTEAENKLRARKMYVDGYMSRLAEAQKQTYNQDVIHQVRSLHASKKTPKTDIIPLAKDNVDDQYMLEKIRHMLMVRAHFDTHYRPHHALAPIRVERALSVDEEARRELQKLIRGGKKRNPPRVKTA